MEDPSGIPSMKRHAQRLSRPRPVLTWLSVLLLGAACHGTGHVREVPRASYPAETPATPAPNDGEHGRDAAPFATPPDEEAARDETFEPGTGPSPTSVPEPWQERASEAAPPARAEAKAASPRRSGSAQDAAPALGHAHGRDDRDSAWRPLPEERP